MLGSRWVKSRFLRSVDRSSGNFGYFYGFGPFDLEVELYWIRGSFLSLRAKASDILLTTSIIESTLTP